MKAIQIGFFDEENRYKKLTELGDPLEKLNSVMNWEISQIRKIQTPTGTPRLTACTVTKKRIKNQEKTEKRHSNAVVIGRNFLNFR